MISEFSIFVLITLVLTFLEKSWSRSSSSLLKPFFPTAITTSTTTSNDEKYTDLELDEVKWTVECRLFYFRF